MTGLVVGLIAVVVVALIVLASAVHTRQTDAVAKLAPNSANGRAKAARVPPEPSGT